MKVYGQLEKAALEVSASDLSGTVTGLMSWNSTSTQAKVSDGTNVRALLRNDLKAIIGNSGTANDNSRFHRGAAGVLQILQAGDATAEGSLSTALNQLSSRVENYTNAGLPAVGNAGRVAYVTDLALLKVDTGSVWQPVGSGGGGGGALQWVEDANAPIPEIENNSRVYLFEAGLSNELYTWIKVPASYLAGSPIKMKAFFYSPSTSNTGLLLAQATLIQKDADAVSDVTDQRTSTNSAVTLSAPANKVRSIEFDLSSSIGEINAVAVAAGDLIKVRVYRDTDTDTESLRFLPYACEVTFNT